MNIRTYHHYIRRFAYYIGHLVYSTQSQVEKGRSTCVYTCNSQYLSSANNTIAILSFPSYCHCLSAAPERPCCSYLTMEMVSICQVQCFISHLYYATNIMNKNTNIYTVEYGDVGYPCEGIVYACRLVKPCITFLQQG